MAVLIVKNVETEGPGTIEDYLRKVKTPYRKVELEKGEIPPPLDSFDTLIVLGGPMSVYEIDIYPQLVTGSRLIREAINRDMKILGICLGAQLLAHCLGADVYRGPEKEIGWFPIELTGEGLKDPLMRKLAIHPTVGDFWRKFRVFHWHGDTFDLPPDAVLLARSLRYEHQAFRYGRRIYGFQFHVEVTREMIEQWCEGLPEMNSVREETKNVFAEYARRAMNFYRAFFSS